MVPSTHLKTAAILIGIWIAGGTTAHSQFGNDGRSIGETDYTGPNGAGTVAAGPKKFGSAAAGEVTGPGLSRLPLTTLDVMPYETMSGDASENGIAGTSRDSKFGSQAYGTATERWPYTTARVAVTGNPGPGSVRAGYTPVTSRPYRQSGKLWMRFGAQWFVCTASLIKKGVLITAAHCVHNYGQGAGGFADEVRWYPANITPSLTTNGGPWGYFVGQEWRVPIPYLNGTDTCQSGADGIVCNNDIATVVLQKKNDRFAGSLLGGWYAYGWNASGFVFSPSFGNFWIAAVHQLGYPAAFDSGYQMQRTTSFAKYVAGPGANGHTLKNVQIGSAQTGGSSGGPWIVNFGTKPNVSAAAFLGASATPNVVVAVTSWGYIDVTINVQGASFFGRNREYPLADYGGYGAGNIGSLVNDTCTANPTFC